MTRLGVRWDALDEVLGRVISGRPLTGAEWAEIGIVLASYRYWKTGTGVRPARQRRNARGAAFLHHPGSISR